MKFNDLKKKIMLNKRTIAHLNRDEMDALRGGDTATEVACNYDTCVYSCTCPIKFPTIITKDSLGGTC